MVQFFIKRVCIGLIGVFICLAVIEDSAFAKESQKADVPQTLVFCSINQSTHRLYKISEAVLSHAFDNLNIGFEMKAYPPNRIAHELNVGKIDGDSHRIFGFNQANTYPNLIRVEEPIQSVAQSVFTRMDNLKVDGWKSLVKYRILFIKGIKVIEMGLEKYDFPKENRLGVYDIDNAFELLDSNRGDLIVVSPSTGNAAIKKLGLENRGIKLLSPPLLTIDLYPYMHKKHGQLAEKLAAQLKRMKANGTYERIINAIP